MDFADAMKLVLGGVTVERKTWKISKTPVVVKLHGNAVVEETPAGLGPYEPGSNDMLATDWQAVSTVPTDQLTLEGLMEEYRQGTKLPPDRGRA